MSFYELLGKFDLELSNNFYRQVITEIVIDKDMWINIFTSEFSPYKKYVLTDLGTSQLDAQFAAGEIIIYFQSGHSILVRKGKQ